MTDLKNQQYAILYRNAPGCAWLLYDIYGAIETAKKEKYDFLDSVGAMKMKDPEVHIVEWTIAD
ncbi:MAG: hypothetical protein ISN29_00030 [Gammaproteobacteria bacterium AqS3]|nr:hypothetical protein [Gammaproteobacteria bacterium AqS3]